MENTGKRIGIKDENCPCLANLISWASRFVSYLVANPEGRFSRDEAQLFQQYTKNNIWFYRNDLKCRTDRTWQTVSDQDVHCLQFCLHFMTNGTIPV